MNITTPNLVLVGLVTAGIWTYAAQLVTAQQSKDERSKARPRNSCCRMDMDMDMEDAMESGRNRRARETGNLSITLRTEPSPPRAGANTFEVIVKDRSGNPVEDAELVLTLRMPAMPSMNMPETQSSVKLNSSDSGVYRGQAELAMAGRWEASITVSRQGRELGTKQVAVLAR